MNMKVFLFFTLFLSTTPAYAYIDPGTGATFVGSMAPLLVGLFTGIFAFFVKVFWNPLKRIFSKFSREKTA